MGVMTDTPARARSSQSRICLGFPLRTTKTAVEVYGALLPGRRLLPVGGDQPAVFGDRVDVPGEGERHDVGLEAVDHGAGLFPRAAVGLPDDHVHAGPGPPVSRESSVVLLVELARRVVRDVEQRGRSGQRGGEGEYQKRKLRHAMTLAVVVTPVLPCSLPFTVYRNCRVIRRHVKIFLGPARIAESLVRRARRARDSGEAARRRLRPSRPLTTPASRFIILTMESGALEADPVGIAASLCSRLAAVSDQEQRARALGRLLARHDPEVIAAVLAQIIEAADRRVAAPTCSSRR